MCSLTLNAVVLDLLVEIVNLYFDIIISSRCIDICSKVLDFAAVT
jgi:hypothetical protein